MNSRDSFLSSFVSIGSGLRRTGRLPPRKVFLIGLLTFLGFGLASVRADALPGWSTNVAVWSATNATDRPALVYFTADWCGPCKLMARTTFVDAAVVRQLQQVARVAVDIDQFPALAQRHAVRAVPTFLLWCAGTEVARATGYQDAAEFQSWFSNALVSAQETTTRLANVRKQIEAVDTALASAEADPQGLRRAASAMFDVVAERDAPGVHEGIARLKAVAARDPALLADGLNDARLAVRIHVANILRDTLGEEFKVDPWADAAERERAAADWRRKLSTPHSMAP